MREKKLTAGDNVIYRPAGERPFRATVEKVNRTTAKETRTNMARGRGSRRREGDEVFQGVCSRGMGHDHRETTMSDTSSDPYAGIDLPKPPRGYRLAKWGEVTTVSVKWLHVDARHKEVESGVWRSHSPLNEKCYDSGLAWNSIFAVPKPRIRIELEQGEEVE